MQTRLLGEGKNYGELLPDQVDRIASSFDFHLELINDIRDLYRDRAALEREYASKLQLLAKKAGEKKSKAEAAIAFGADPAKDWDADTLKKNSLNVAYTELVDAMSGTAQDHIKLAEDLNSQVVDVLAVVEKKSEEAKKKEVQFFQKITKDRDQVYGDRQKSKQKYDDHCTESESLRQKQNRSTQDDKHADRIMKQAEHQRNEMLNSKNEYIISTAVANSAKSQFYATSLPLLENEFQILQQRLVERVVKILQHSDALQLRHLDLIKTRVGRVDTALGRVNPAMDQDLFIDHNIRQFSQPQDWTFEPCTFYYDTSGMSTEPGPKVFIQNKLNRCRSKLQELAPVLVAKQNDSDQMSARLYSYTVDHTLGDIDEFFEKWLEAQHQLIIYLTTEVLLNAEMKVVVASIGDDEGVKRPHAFKSSTFSIPTQCTYCKNSIWGLTKQGKTCKSCGISVHAKCELKVPAECGHVGSTSLRTSRAGLNTPTSRSSSQNESPSISSKPPPPPSFVGPDTPESPEQSYSSAMVLFEFSAGSECEMKISEGEVVRVIEPDDGSGWVKAVNENGDSGLVPASYLRMDATTPAGGQQTVPHFVDGGPGKLSSSKSFGSGIYVRALYAYESQCSDELSLDEGERIELSSGPAGGQSYGDGWWEGFDSSGKKGIFPSNYVTMS